MRAPIIEVAASIVRAPDGRVLMAERTRKQLSPGFWELPGGKIEPGESAREAAIRELEEEIGIRALSIAPWIQYEHPFVCAASGCIFSRWISGSALPTGGKVSDSPGSILRVQRSLRSCHRCSACLMHSGFHHCMPCIDPATMATFPP